jgi:hypothetical protein
MNFIENKNLQMYIAAPATIAVIETVAITGPDMVKNYQSWFTHLSVK